MYVSIHRQVCTWGGCANCLTAVTALAQWAHSWLQSWTAPGQIYISPRTTTMILTQLAKLVVSHLPWAGQSAGLWCSSPEQCVDGHSAWLPLVPCESPQAAVFHLLLLVPVIPLSPGNAEKNTNHNRNREDISIDQHMWTPLSAKHQNLSPLSM